MSWQRRLLELACAGGALFTQAGCPTPHQPPGGCGNANPDPCICGREPEDSPQCVAERECAAYGGDWEFYGARIAPSTIDAGTQLWGRCVYPVLDAGVSDVPLYVPDAYIPK